MSPFFLLSLSLSKFILFLYSPSLNSFSLSFRIIATVRTLLSLIPINQKVLEALEVFVHPISSQGASEDTRLPPSPKAVLSEFYDAAAVSPTLLLYNLEVYIHVHILHIVHIFSYVVLYMYTIMVLFFIFMYLCSISHSGCLGNKPWMYITDACTYMYVHVLYMYM